MEPIPQQPRPRVRIASHASAACGVLALSLLLGGCAPSLQQAANLWEAHYEGQRLQPLGETQAVDLTAVPPHEMHGSPPLGWTRLGTSVFVEDFDLKDHGLEAFARSIGATRVLWDSHSTGWASYRSTYRVPVTDTSRTTGTAKGPDGTARDVDLTTTTQRWEERTVERSREQFAHHAAFLVRAPR
ncbi:MAG: hypothetical protein KF787_08685 [Phycisphaeraceae bacterium]|nr:hypothetical protein [Phycisphaerae bacterium]MBX3392711.1 hypothetical protein [Phycisphaeraceae bacterium]